MIKEDINPQEYHRINEFLRVLNLRLEELVTVKELHMQDTLEQVKDLYIQRFENLILQIKKA